MTTNQQEYIRLCSLPQVQEKIREGLGPVRRGDWYFWDGWCVNVPRVEVADNQHPRD
jgi:hypothetical protein